MISNACCLFYENKWITLRPANLIRPISYSGECDLMIGSRMLHESIAPLSIECILLLSYIIHASR